MTSDKCMDKKTANEYQATLDAITTAIKRREELRAQAAIEEITVSALAEKFFRNFGAYLPEGWKSVYNGGYRITQSTQEVFDFEDFKAQFPFLIETALDMEVEGLKKRQKRADHAPSQTIMKNILKAEFPGTDATDLLPSHIEHKYPCALMTADDYMEVARREAADEHPRTEESN